MEDEKTTLLKLAKGYFDKRNTTSFTETIIELYTRHITCNCFFEQMGEDYWQSMRNEIGYLGFNNNLTFHVCFARGFIYLQCKEEYKAYVYLTNAIALLPTHDVAFSLRATINIDINENTVKDAEEAVLLNASARNYFVLASILDQRKSSAREQISFENIKDSLHPTRLNYLLLKPDNFEGFRNENLIKSIIYFDKAISLNRNFSCAYYHKAIKYKLLGDRKKSTEAILNYIEIADWHQEHYQIWELLFYLKSPKSLEIANIGFGMYPDNAIYNLAIGREFLEKGDSVAYRLSYVHKFDNEHELRFNTAIDFFKTAIDNFDIYIKAKKINSSDYRNTAKSQLFELLFKRIGISYNLKQHNVTKRCFEEILNYEPSFFKCQSENYPDFENMFGNKKNKHPSDFISIYLGNKLYSQKGLSFHLQNSERAEKIHENLSNWLEKSNEKNDIKPDSSSYNSFIWSLQNKISWGHYAGFKIEELITDDPKFILTSIINIDHFIISNYLLANEKFEVFGEYLEAIEVNLLKNIFLRAWFEENVPYEMSDESMKSWSRHHVDIAQELAEDEMRDIDETDPTWRIANDFG